MNNRQAGAFREMIRKEERARERWHDDNRHLFNGGTRELGTYGDEKRIVRTVEVPFTQSVQVPVKTMQVVPTRSTQKVATRRMMEVPAFKEVKQKYTVVENRPAMRQKEIWVKKVVPERYMKRVEVPRTRIVKVPHKTIENVPSFDIVEVVEHRPMSVDGYRIDTVEDAVADGQGHAAMNRSLNRSRIIGKQVYHPNDERVRSIPLCSRANSPSSYSALVDRRSGNGYRPRTTGQLRRTRQVDLRASQRPLANVEAVPLAVRLKTSGAGHSGLLVQKVGHAGAAERAGLTKGDIVQYINNRPTRTMEEFRDVLTQSSGPLHLTVARGGPTALHRIKMTVVR